MEDTREKILEFMRRKGPVLPADVAKHINSNILFASAHLAELSSSGKLKVSSIKVGGSPLYYLQGQDAQLEGFSDNLNDKDKRAFDLLLQKKVLRDIELEPLLRVALRSLKDFAVPLQVNLQDSTEIFWRWHQVTNQEAEILIKPLFEEKKKEEAKQEQKAKEEIPEVDKRQEIVKQEIKEVLKQELAKPEQVKEKKPLKAKVEPSDMEPFFDKITKYLSKNKIEVIQKDAIKKSEVDFILKVPSAVGNIDYYCKAKSKQKLTDADLASAFVQGQIKKLPVLLLTDGEMTKRAKEMLEKDFKGMSIARI